MITMMIRKQGGAAIVTIPSDVLKMLHTHVGAMVELDVTKNGLMLRPIQTTSARKHYSLKELMQGVSTKQMKALHKKTAWAREGKPMGREKV